MRLRRKTRGRTADLGSRRPLLLYSLLLIALLTGCQALTQGSSALIVWISPSPSPIPPSSTPTATATASPSVTPSATATPTPSPTPTATPTPRPTASALQLEVLDELWRIVNEEYLYGDFNGLDWDQVYIEYRQRVAAGLTEAEFYESMEEMIGLLDDDHSVFLPPDVAVQNDLEYAGEADFVGIGVMVVPIPERQREAVLLTFPEGPAAEAGIRPRDSILAVDGQPILDENGQHRDLIAGPEGTTVVLIVQTPGEAPREVPVERRRISRSLPVPYEVFETPGGQRIGYILLVSFLELSIYDKVGQALHAMTADEPLDGLIIDNRWNTGGTDVLLKSTLSYFTTGVVGQFLNRHNQRPLLVRGADLQGSQRLPLVVLIGPDTVSFGEIFAGILQNIGRAYLIGESTRGNVETLWGYELPDGSRAWIAHDIFVPLNLTELNWELSGVFPDLVVPAELDLYPVEQDPAVLAAIRYLERQ